MPREENEAARFFICEGGRRPLHFWITKRTPPRFCIGIGRRGREVVQILSKLGLFGDKPGSSRADGSGRTRLIHRNCRS